MLCRRICGDERAREIAIDSGPSHVVARRWVGGDILRRDDPLVVPGSERLPGHRYALIPRTVDATLQVGGKVFDRQRRLDQFTVDRGVQLRLRAVAFRINPAPLDAQRHEEVSRCTFDRKFVAQHFERHRRTNVAGPDRQVCAAGIDHHLRRLVPRRQRAQRRHGFLQPTEMLVVEHQGDHFRKCSIIHPRNCWIVVTRRRIDDHRTQCFHLPRKRRSHEGLRVG